MGMGSATSVFITAVETSSGIILLNNVYTSVPLAISLTIRPGGACRSVLLDSSLKPSTRPVLTIVPLATMQTTKPKCARANAIPSSISMLITRPGNACPRVHHNLTSMQTSTLSCAPSPAPMHFSQITGLVPACLPSTALTPPLETLTLSAA